MYLRDAPLYFSSFGLCRKIIALSSNIGDYRISTIFTYLDICESVIGPKSTTASSRGWSSAKSLAVIAELAPLKLADVRQRGSCWASVWEMSELGTRTPIHSHPGFTCGGKNCGRSITSVTGPGRRSQTTLSGVKVQSLENPKVEK